MVRGNNIIKNTAKAVGYTILLTFAIGVLVISLTFYSASKHATKLTLNTSGQNIERNISILDANGKPLVQSQKQQIFEPAVLSGKGKNVSDLYIHGLVAVEDKTFFTRDKGLIKEKGYSIKGLVNALLSQIKSKFTNTEARGGSTIDQQLVKNIELGGVNAPETIKRKQIELIDSHYLATKYSRENILSSYINTLALYPDSVGAVSAYKDLFGTSMPVKNNYDAENLDRLAFIVGLGQSPTTYIQQFDTLGKNRTKTVLGMWLDSNLITKKQYYSAIKGLGNFKIKNSTTFSVAREYQAYVTEVQQELSKLSVPENSDVVIKTYATQEQLAYLDKIANFKAPTNTSLSYQTLPDGLLTAISAIDTNTGHILALATNSSNPLIPIAQGRSSGSSIKPILDYAPAIEYGYVNSSSYLNGNSTSYADGTSLTNYGGYNYGNVPIGYALGLSLNTSALQVFNMTSTLQKNALMKPLGIASSSYNQSDSINYSNLSPLQLASAYSAIGNDGVRITPTSIENITVDGKEFTLPPQQKVRAMSSSTAKTLVDLLQNVTASNGSEPSAKEPQWAGGFAVKSGLVGFDEATSNQINAKAGADVMPSSDAWLAGTSSGVSLTAWLGTPDLSGNSYIQGGLNGSSIQENNGRVYLFNNAIQYMNQGRSITPFKYSGQKLQDNAGLETIPTQFNGLSSDNVKTLNTFKLPELEKISKQDQDYYKNNENISVYQK